MSSEVVVYLKTTGEPIFREPASSGIDKQISNLHKKYKRSAHLIIVLYTGTLGGNKMKCPHCEYLHQPLFGNPGEHGDFFLLPIKLARNEATAERETKALYGCPACNKTFIGE